jgi:hypothetical protein
LLIIAFGPHYVAVLFLQKCYSNKFSYNYITTYKTVTLYNYFHLFFIFLKHPHTWHFIHIFCLIFYPSLFHPKTNNKPKSSFLFLLSFSNLIYKTLNYPFNLCRYNPKSCFEFLSIQLISISPFRWWQRRRSSPTVFLLNIIL